MLFTSRSSQNGNRSTRKVWRITAAAVLGAGLSLALVTPAQAAANGLSPSNDAGARANCTYYHDNYNGRVVGAGYGCSPGAPGTYRAWVVCSNGVKYFGPYTNGRSATPISVRDCPSGTSPHVGGYDYA